MQYRRSNMRRYLQVLFDNKEEMTSYDLLGFSGIKNSEWVNVENCLANNLVLGINEMGYISESNFELKYSDRLKDYQVRDVQFMASRDKCLNFNRMGYGKTVEAIFGLRERDVANAIIVAPKTILDQWAEEIRRWWPEAYSRVVVIRKGGVDHEKFSSDSIVIINYEKLSNDNMLQDLKRFRWDALVADEAHKLKNHNSQRSKNVQLIPSKIRWGLTGTPVLNHPDDLFGLLKFLGEEFSGRSYYRFRDYFCNVVTGFFGQKVEGLTKDLNHMDVLNKLLDCVAVRNPPLNLTPGRDAEIVKLSMSKAQKAIYGNVRKLILDELPEELTIPNGAVLCVRLQQITSCPYKWTKEYGVKLEYIAELMSNNPGEKFVIFSQYIETCNSLNKYLSSKKINSVLYTGTIAEVDKLTGKHTFINDPNCRAIIGTIGAMSEGLDGLQRVCSNVIFIDRDWSPEIMQQAEARVDRFGQSKRVQVKYLECLGTYDRHVGRVVLKKSADIRRILNDKEQYEN